MQLRNACLFLFLAITISGCKPDSGSSAEKLGPEAWLPMKLGEVPFEAQVVLTPEEQRKGLMHRDHLPENSGMLFPYPTPRRLSFWMANTRIPLSIGFFDGSGLLLEIHHMVPFDTNRTVSHGDDMHFALEMNDGWFARNGLYPGQRLDMPLLAEALRRRGADPDEFGIDAPAD
jgi:uncharacterized membrane protein (UPF0127 family)